jgi:hypothetical protein
MIDDRDDDRVALECDAVILYWTCRFGVTRDELEEAIEMVGDDAGAVAAYLNIAG